MKPVAIGVSGVAVTIGLLVVAAYWTLNSLWLLWELLPVSAPERAAVSLAAAQRLGATAMTSALLPAVLKDAAADVAAVAWMPGVNPSRLVLLPRVAAQFRLPRALAREGWRIERRGLALVAHSPEDAYPPAPTISDALRAVTTRRVVASGWPLRPAALWARVAGGHGSLLPAGTVVATAHGRALRLLFVRDRGALAGKSVAARAAVPAADLELTVTGAGLAERLQSAEHVWDPALAQALHFSRTQPPFTAQLLRHPSGGRIVWQGSEAAVQVAGDAAAFVSAATTWVQDEERHGRLETRSFRLPDGTLGQERVPGEPQPVFAVAPQGGCFAPLPERTTLWLCQQGETTALATSEQLSRQVLEQPTNPAGIFVSTAGLRQLLGRECGTASWCHVRKALLRGNSGRAAAEITF